MDLKLLSYRKDKQHPHLRVLVIDYPIDVSMTAETRFCVHRFFFHKSEFIAYKYKVRAWIKENSRGMFMLESQFGDSRHMVVGFEDENSAFAFKMRWC